MIIHHLERLNLKRIILASQSPRRVEILKKIGLNFEVIPSKFEENLDKAKFTADQYVIENAKQKAMDVLRSVCPPGEGAAGEDESSRPDLIIGSDTVVVLDGTILEKPKDEQDAANMLKSLSGRSHHVLSGVSLCYKGASFQHPHNADADGNLPPPQIDGFPAMACATFFERTEVHFDNLSSEAIAAYIQTGEPMDKAGSYGIQAIGGSFVKGIEGCYFNVMGFPLHRFCSHMSSMLPAEDK